MKASNNYRHGHRARLYEKFDNDEESLGTEEILEALLFDLLPRIDTKPIARELLKKLGGPYGLLTTPLEDLTAVHGIGFKTARQIRLMRRLFIAAHEDKFKSTPIYHDILSFKRYCLLELMNKREEEVHVFYLNRSHQLLEKEVHSRGTTTETAIYPDRISKRASELGAKIVTLLHNHPSGAGMLSTPDMEMTARTKHKLGALEIELHDHYLVAGSVVYSAKDSEAWRIISEKAAGLAAANAEKHLEDAR